MATYARNVKFPVWYPKTLPAGYKLDTVDIVEFDPGTGLVCSLVFLNGNKALVFTQGSPKAHGYPITSAGKTAWDGQRADVMYQDPADKTTPPMIIYNSGGNFNELQGDPGLADLKKVAASMVLVK